ncbi:MAG TPA: sensor histidine kinase [Gallionella sp.]|nr:sensor histidine kinase [Gallionella sp.]
MNDKRPAAARMASLREDAEALIPHALTPETQDEVLHELRVHQIELEMQAEELRSAEVALEVSRDRYLDLYDFAPVGYLSLNRDGLVTEINLTGAALLGIERAKIRQRRFINFIAPSDIERWHRHFTGLFNSREKRRCEMALIHADGSSFHARLDALHMRTDSGAETLRIAFSDISESKLAMLELEESRKLLRELAARNETLLEDERKRISREVHDELGQLLTVLRMDISLQRIQFSHYDPALFKMTQGMLKLTDKIINEVRNVATNLRPTALDCGILPALAWLCDEFNHHSTQACTLLAPDGPIELNEASTLALFRIVQESLTNVLRYAEAHSVEITIRREVDCIVTTVSDDGKGFDPSATAPKKSFGLLGMRERALAAGGEIEISSAPSLGTTITVRIPIHPPKDIS